MWYINPKGSVRGFEEVEISFNEYTFKLSAQQPNACLHSYINMNIRNKRRPSLFVFNIKNTKISRTVDKISKKTHCFNIQTLCSIFDTFVNSILLWGSEIWGFHRAQDVEKVVKKKY